MLLKVKGPNMETVIKIIGIAIVVTGIAYLFRPDIMKRLMEFFKKDARIYIAGLVRFVLGVVFLLAARECDRSAIIGALGVLFLAGGVLIFILGSERMRRILEWWLTKPVWIMQILAVVTAAFGALIIYAA